MRDISAHGKVPLASITYFFKTKENLFLECLRESLEVYFDYREMFAPQPVERTAVAAADAIEQKIIAVFDRFYREERTGQQPWHSDIIVSAVLSHEPFHMAPMGQMIMASKAWFEPRLHKIKPRISEGEAFAWHMELWAMVSFLSMSRSLILARMGQGQFTRQLVESFGGYAAHVLLSGLKGKVRLSLPALRGSYPPPMTQTR